MQRERAIEGRGESGFTLVEMLVALFVTVELILAVLLLFDFSNKLTRVQTNVADMQQSLRVAQYDTVRFIRMLRRGGLPLGPLTAVAADANASATLNGIGIAVRDNAAVGALIAGPNSPAVVTGSDVLIIRGAFSNPVYQVNSAFATLDRANGTGTLVIPSTVPTASGIGGIPQHLDALAGLKAALIPEALLLVSPVNDSIYAVVELDPANTTIAAAGTTIAFKFTGTLGLGGIRTNNYNALSPGGVFPANLTTVSTVSILEEYRVYVRSFYNNPPAGGATADDKAAALNSKLSRARVFPNSDAPWGSPNPAIDNTPNLKIDVADDVTDLQVALGFDSQLAGGTMRGHIKSTIGIVDTGDANDDWLFNSANDIPINNITNWDSGTLYYVRLNTLVRTDRPDPKYTAPAVIGIEDNSYTGSPFNVGKNLMFRRRILQTVVDVRSLG